MEREFPYSPPNIHTGLNGMTDEVRSLLRKLLHIFIPHPARFLRRAPESRAFFQRQCHAFDLVAGGDDGGIAGVFGAQIQLAVAAAMDGLKCAAVLAFGGESHEHRRAVGNIFILPDRAEDDQIAFDECRRHAVADHDDGEQQLPFDADWSWIVFVTDAAGVSGNVLLEIAVSPEKLANRAFRRCRKLLF
jgi:hypothetical protein